MVRYLVLNCTATYNVLIGRQTINDIHAVVSTPHLKMKYPTKSGRIGVFAVDQRIAKECLAENEIKYAKWGKQAIKEGHRVFEMSAHVTHAIEEQSSQDVIMEDPQDEDRQDYALDPRAETSERPNPWVVQKR